MFDKKKISSDQGGAISKPASAEPAAVRDVVVHVIPPEFYDGGTGDGGIHAPVKREKPTTAAKAPPVAGDKPKKQDTVAPQVKPLALEARASSQFTSRGVSPWLIVGVVVFGVLAAAGGFAYWWVVVRQEPPAALPPTPIVAEPIIPPEPEPIEEPEPEPIEEPEPEPVVPVYPVGLREYQLSVDSDLDGLTDIEEQQVYGSNALRPDDDSDGYVDGHEVFHLYNPAARAPVALIDSGLVVLHENTTFGYTVYVPRVWTRDAVDADGQDTLFTAATGEFVEILVHPNEDEVELSAWYRSRAPAVSADQIRSVSTKRGLTGVLSPDSLSLFVARGALVYELRYDIGTRADANFMRTFVMMQNSFEFTSEPQYVPDEIVEQTVEAGVAVPAPLELIEDQELFEPVFGDEPEEDFEAGDTSAFEAPGAQETATSSPTPPTGP